MGTWSSAAPRGQFGDQAGDTIFTSNRPISSRRRLGGDGFRERDHSAPPSHFGEPHKEDFGCVSQPPSSQPGSPTLPSTQPSTKPTGLATKI